MTAIQALVILLVLPSMPAYAERAPDEPWKEFVSVAGQPEPVPAQWVSTPEGKLAHSIVIPNPVPKDSGYRWWMSSERYFEHLCNTEAGEFIFKTVDNVEGFYFMRPPGRPTDTDLMDRYKLEAPEIERTYQLRPATPASRARMFINPPWSRYQYIEEPNQARATPEHRFIRLHGYVQNKHEMEVVPVSILDSQFGLVWRGVKHRHDRESDIAGSEWIVLDLKTQEVLAVHRNYARSGFMRDVPNGIYWLNAASCPKLSPRDNLSRRFYRFVSKVLVPSQKE